MSMDIQEIRRHLSQPAIKLVVGGFQPSNEDDESWFGKVFLFRPDEVVPKNDTGDDLHPYAQFHLPNLPFRIPALEGVRVLTLFVSDPIPEAFEPMGNNWLIREYGVDDVLVRKELSVTGSHLKPFPLNAELIAEDFPVWDGGGVPKYLEDEICKLEETGKIESYYDMVTHTDDHKIGGYPSFCQPGIDVGDDFQFVFQITSDSRLNLNVVDSGSLMFWKHKTTGEWVIYYDFY